MSCSCNANVGPTETAGDDDDDDDDEKEKKEEEMEETGVQDATRLLERDDDTNDEEERAVRSCLLQRRGRGRGTDIGDAEDVRQVTALVAVVVSPSYRHNTFVKKTGRSEKSRV